MKITGTFEFETDGELPITITGGSVTPPPVDPPPVDPPPVDPPPVDPPPVDPPPATGDYTIDLALSDGDIIKGREYKFAGEFLKGGQDANDEVASWEWWLDGAAFDTQTGYPWDKHVNTHDLSEGEHFVQVQVRTKAAFDTVHRSDLVTVIVDNIPNPIDPPVGGDEYEVTTPQELAEALVSNFAPGSIIRVRPGVYPGRFLSTLQGGPGGQVRVLADEGVLIDPQTDGAGLDAGLKITGSYTDYEGFEIAMSDPVRSKRMPYGVTVLGQHNNFRHLIIHDCGQGMSHGTAHQSDYSEIEGCLMFNNSWREGDRCHGHAIYGQGNHKTVRNSVFFGGGGYGPRWYGTGNASPASDLHMEQCVVLNHGWMDEGYAKTLYFVNIGTSNDPTNCTFQRSHAWNNSDQGYGFCCGTHLANYTDNSIHCIDCKSYGGLSPIYVGINKDVQLRNCQSVSADRYPLYCRSDAGPKVIEDLRIYGADRIKFPSTSKPASRVPGTTHHEMSELQDEVIVHPIRADRALAIVYNWSQAATVEVANPFSGPCKVIDLQRWPQVVATGDGSAIQVPMPDVEFANQPVNWRTGVEVPHSGSRFGVYWIEKV